MEFVAKNEAIDINDPILNLTNDVVIKNKMFYFSEISDDTSGIKLYLDESQITENLSFDCLIPFDSKIEKVYVSNKNYPLYLNEGLISENENLSLEKKISYTKQSFNIIVDNSNFNIFSNIKKFKLKGN